MRRRSGSWNRGRAWSGRTDSKWLLCGHAGREGCRLFPCTWLLFVFVLPFLALRA